MYQKSAESRFKPDYTEPLSRFLGVGEQMPVSHRAKTGHHLNLYGKNHMVKVHYIKNSAIIFS